MAMKLDDQITAIFNEINLNLYDEKQADWLFRNFNKALVRARKLEKLADAVEVLNSHETD